MAVINCNVNRSIMQISFVLAGLGYFVLAEARPSLIQRKCCNGNGCDSQL